LFRFLEHRDVDRPSVDGRALPDVRVMAATSKTIGECVDRGTFLDDLHHRLNVVSIRVPPLRERLDDVEELTAFFLDRFCRQHNREVSLAPACLVVMCAHGWPGNVRELRNLIERVVVLARTNPVEPDELRHFLGFSVPSRRDRTLRAALDGPAREALVRSLTAERVQRRRRRRHSFSRKVNRWLKKIPRRTMATVVVGMVPVIVLLLMLLWKLLTGVWLLDKVL
jgi:DNA-binding NtrC family response regulator